MLVAAVCVEEQARDVVVLNVLRDVIVSVACTGLSRVATVVGLHVEVENLRRAVATVPCWALKHGRD